MPIGLAGAAAIAGGIGAAGSLASSGVEFAANKHLQEDAQRFTELQNQLSRDFSSAEAVKQRDWEKMMSDTSYQRQVADMIAAGINPASIGMSGGASTPNGSAASSNVGGSASMNSISARIDTSLFNSAFAKAMLGDRSFSQDYTRALVSEARAAAKMKDVQDSYFNARTRYTQAKAGQAEHILKNMLKSDNTKVYKTSGFEML